MSVSVVLTPAELEACRKTGKERMAMAKGRPRFAYTVMNGTDTHTIGCMGELAAAKAIGIEWPARVGTYRLLPDLDPHWEVRWTSNPTKVKVIPVTALHPDRASDLVCHVTGWPPRFEVHGFILAGWAQEHAPLYDPGDRQRPIHMVSAYTIAPINPGFHSACGWWRCEEHGGWECIYCGARPS